MKLRRQDLQQVWMLLVSVPKTKPYRILLFSSGVGETFIPLAGANTRASSNKYRCETSESN